MLNKLKRPERQDCMPATRLLCTVVVAALFASGLTACQPDGPPALSLNDAKQVVTGFEKQAFVAPPRTITDITAILNKEKRENRPQTAADDEMLTRAPPKTADKLRLAAFYHQRGRAAQKTGRSRQAIGDYKKALELGRADDAAETAKLWHRLASVENQTGRLRDAVSHIRRAIALNDRGGRDLDWTLKLGIWLLASGNIEGAEETAEQAETSMEKFRNATRGGRERAWRKNGVRWQAEIIRLRAKILERRGKYAEAGVMLKSSYDNLIAAVEGNDGTVKVPQRRLENAQASLGMNLLRQGRLIEAEIETRGALTSALRRTGRYGPTVANYTANLASIMAAQGRASDAEALARESIEIAQTIGAREDSRLMQKTRRMLASSLAAQGRWPEVIVQFDAISAVAEDSVKRTERRVSGNPLYAMALINSGRAAEAIKVAERAVRRAGKTVGEKHYRAMHFTQVQSIS